VHRILRAATRNDHALVDRMLLHVDLNRTGDYVAFLNVHFAALIALQADWRLQDDADFAQMLDCLRADLTRLNAPTTTTPTPPRAAPALAKGFGIAYVVRGSRLGAAVLRRSITAELPTSYLDFVPSLSWPVFLGDLEVVVEQPNGAEEAAAAAQGAFKIFVDEFKRIQDIIATPPP
jgi:heme oxygenase